MLNATTLEFLGELAENNHRPWFEDNKKRYQAAKKDIATLVDNLIVRLIDIEPELEGLEAKNCVFRIFRDVRFSKNKAPYKTNLGAWIARGGRKSIYAGYYLHVEPGEKSFLAGGSYMPPSDVLKAIREAIDYDPDSLRSVIQAPDFKDAFGELGGDKLKTAPRDYAKDHPAIDLLRHKSFVVNHPIGDAQLLDGGFLDHAIQVYSTLKPLNDYLNLGISN
ncbi:MAG: DUF2461 domain-containing protein [Bacteroidota bacterium]